MQDGFLRAAAASIPVAVADPRRNAAAVCARIDQAHRARAALLVLPELCVTGYTCGDLFLSALLLDAAEEALLNICAHTQNCDPVVVLGVPLRAGGKLYNCAAVLHRGRILGIVPKTWLPNYDVFAEKRCFASAAAYHGPGSVPEGAGARAVPFSMPLRPTPLSRAVSPHPFVPDDAVKRRKRAELLLSIQAHGLRKRLLHTGSRAALLPVTDDLDSVLALLVCARTMNLLGRARHDVLAVTQPGGDRAHVLRLCKALGVSVRPNADLAGLARTHAALPLAAPDFTALLLGEAVCAPEAYGVNAAVPRTLVRWLIAAEAERAEAPLRAELRAALSAPDADCAGISCALTDFCFYHLVRCGAHPRRILRLARAAFGDAAADADILRAMAALTRCLFRRPAALPDHVALGSSAQALHWPPDAAGSLWSEEIDALRRELS